MSSGEQDVIEGTQEAERKEEKEGSSGLEKKTGGKTRIENWDTPNGRNYILYV